MKKQIINNEQSITYNKVETNPEFSRILCAAVVNKSFRNRLLADPAKAVEMGFGGEKFHLKENELHNLASIQACSLSDFAAQLINVSRPITVEMSYAACD